jgi:serine-type D-Ala-D-Ala endopeptidase (penicillin-binding protein 7)
MRAVAFVTVLIALALPAHADDAASGPPEIRSEAAVVLDARTGAEVYAKDADAVRGIASTSKIFVALAVRRKGIVLDDWTEITQADVKSARGGARTRLDRGQTFKNIDLMRAMLMASDNRAPSALGRAVGLDRDGLIAEMNAVADDLGLKQSRFTDVSGMKGNVSTARELALALRAALEDKVIAEIMTTDYVRIVSKSNYAKLDYGNTNQPLLAKTFKVTGGKTGYTRKAGYCFAVSAEIDDREYVMAFLDSDGKTTRFADFNEIAGWIDDGAAGSKVKLKGKKAKKVAAGDKPVRVHASGRATK